MENVYSYADVLESYMIAEEGLGDAIKKAGSKIVSVLKGLKDKIVQFFQKIVASIKSKLAKREKSEKKDPPSRGGQYAIFNLCLNDMQKSLGCLSKAIGASRTVNDTGDDDVQKQIEYFNEFIDKADERIDRESEWTVLDSKIIDGLVKRAESIKNTFMQEVDLAIRVVDASHYNMAQNARHLSPQLANQICSANSKFLKTYSNLLRHLEFCSSTGDMK